MTRFVQIPSLQTNPVDLPGGEHIVVVHIGGFAIAQISNELFAVEIDSNFGTVETETFFPTWKLVFHRLEHLGESGCFVLKSTSDVRYLFFSDELN